LPSFSSRDTTDKIYWVTARKAMMQVQPQDLEVVVDVLERKRVAVRSTAERLQETAPIAAIVETCCSAAKPLRAFHGAASYVVQVSTS
jgi:hypothetical protein